MRAVLTTRGSAVIIPATSVQIWISRAPTPRPMMAAVKSLPPRPRVVISPRLFRAMNPVTTGSFRALFSRLRTIP